MKKTVLITGASRGIGRETAKLFLENNYNVIVNYNKNKKKAEDFFKSYNDCFLYKCDVSKINEVKEMVNSVIEKYGKIDCLVNNAGVALKGLFQDMEEEDYNKIFDTNVKGTFNVIKEVLPYMIREKRGKIINVSSMWGITGGSTEVLYSASKAAIIGLTKALAKEVGPSSINVNAVAPGVIKTDMTSDLSESDIEALKYETPVEKIGKPYDVAKTILFLSSEDSDFITGQVISVDGGITI